MRSAIAVNANRGPVVIGKNHMSEHEVYLAADPVNAEIVKDMLASHGIRAHVRSYYLWGGMGELPANVYPSIWVEDADDYTSARTLIEAFERGPIERGRAWRCPNCGERLAAQFDRCWNCETAKPRD